MVRVTSAPSGQPSNSVPVDESDCGYAVATDKIAARFSAAASVYREHDLVQRLCAHKLLAGFAPRGRLLDIGAGPGTDFAALCPGADTELKQVVALDIAEGMLARLKATFPGYAVLAGDAQQLPLRDAHFDSLYSNLALQWCEDFPRAIDEAARVLVPQGEFHLSVVAEGSLAELGSLGLRVNAFMDMTHLRQAFEPSKWQLLGCELVNETVYFDSLRALLYSIKGVGASVATGKAQVQAQAQAPLAQGFSQGLRGRQDWLTLQQQAERLRTEQGLPLTYKVAYIRARRLPAGETLPERESAA